MSTTSFQIPQKVIIDQENNFSGTFIFEPLERGFGITIGNALRRVLISSLDGYAVSKIKIPGIQHEFSTIEGVREQVLHIILNLKKIVFKPVTESDNETINIKIENQSQFKAGDIEKFTPNFKVLNPDLVISNFSPGVEFEIELTVRKGRGYIPFEENKIDANQQIGEIAIDSVFSPIKNVKYDVSEIRVGQKVDFENWRWK